MIDNVFPNFVNDYVGWIVTCSRYSSTLYINWIIRLKEVFLNILNHSVPIVGICFGHQLIALSLGGKVKKMPNWIVGMQNIIFEDNYIFQSRETKLLGIHQEEVISLPKNVLVIGSTDRIGIAAFTFDDFVLGLQYHMEFSIQYFNALIKDRINIIGKKLYSDSTLKMNTYIGSDRISEEILLFLLRRDKSIIFKGE